MLEFVDSDLYFVQDYYYYYKVYSIVQLIVTKIAYKCYNNDKLLFRRTVWNTILKGILDSIRITESHKTHGKPGQSGCHDHIPTLYSDLFSNLHKFCNKF